MATFGRHIVPAWRETYHGTDGLGQCPGDLRAFQRQIVEGVALGVARTSGLA